MSLREQLKEAQKDAMRAKDKVRLGTIRMVLAEIKNREINDKVELDETGILAVVTKAVKQRKDAIAQYQEAGRDDLVAIESAEIEVLHTFLPQPLNDDELTALITAAIAETGASSMQDMGKVMAALKSQVQGRTDMGALSTKVRNQLA